MFNNIVGAVGAASRYGSDQKMRLRLRNTAYSNTIVRPPFPPARSEVEKVTHSCFKYLKFFEDI
jgi:hypothetical protein